MKISQTDTPSCRILVSGHRNPDIDSLAAAAALAELRRRQGVENIRALCPGVLPERAAHLFRRFKQTPPESRNDVYTRIRDVTTRVPAIPSGVTLFEAVAALRESGRLQLPVADKKGKFLGMLSSLSLLSNLLGIGDDAGSSLTGRRIHTTLQQIRKVLEGEMLTGVDHDTPQDFEVYVAAMSFESFEEHLPGNNRELAVIAGDRPDIHLRALHRKLRLMIVTGKRPIDPLIVEGAAREGVSVIQTPFDSATAIRRLKFSVPVELCPFPPAQLVLRPDDRLRDVRGRVLSQPEEAVPVVDPEGIYQGVLLKETLSSPPPFRLILVDHNEIDQSIPGAEEVPIIEVVDHHRMGMPPTNAPIKFTGDVVGSTCTLVAQMYRSSGESLGADMAGLLLGGIISDTLLLKSPTTAAPDRRMVEWLEKVSGVSAEELMGELLQIDSPLASKNAAEVVGGDRKDYTDGRFHFALSQVEETNLELLHQRRAELAAEMQTRVIEDKLDFFALLVTDAVRENSELLFVGSPEFRRNLPYEQHDEELFLLPGVLSRKKQLLPQILAVSAALQQE